MMPLSKRVRFRQVLIGLMTPLVFLGFLACSDKPQDPPPAEVSVNCPPGAAGANAALNQTGAQIPGFLQLANVQAALAAQPQQTTVTPGQNATITAPACSMGQDLQSTQALQNLVSQVGATCGPSVASRITPLVGPMLAPLLQQTLSQPGGLGSPYGPSSAYPPGVAPGVPYDPSSPVAPNTAYGAASPYPGSSPYGSPILPYPPSLPYGATPYPGAVPYGIAGAIPRYGITPALAPLLTALPSAIPTTGLFAGACQTLLTNICAQFTTMAGGNYPQQQGTIAWLQSAVASQLANAVASQITSQGGSSAIGPVVTAMVASNPAAFQQLVSQAQNLVAMNLPSACGPIMGPLASNPIPISPH